MLGYFAASQTHCQKNCQKINCKWRLRSTQKYYVKNYTENVDAVAQKIHKEVNIHFLFQVRLAVQRWQSRQPDALVAFLELWRPLVI